MDFDSSAKFISSLAKFLQSLCNGYVEFDSGVEVIGHIYLNVDTGKKIDYVLNEKVCKTDENSVTFISNSFHAQPAEKPKPSEKPKQSVPSEVDTSDKEIVLLDEEDTSYDQYSDNVPHNSAPHPKPQRSHGASKRSYSQSFALSNRSSIKTPKFDSTLSSSNPNGAHIPSNSNNSVHDSSFNLNMSGNITAASESDISHLSQVFPENINDSSNTQERDIKPVLDKDLNVINVKQEYDPSSEGQRDVNTYDEQGDGSYYSQDQSYESGNEQYYGSGHQNSSQRSDYDSKMYLGDPGSSGSAGDTQGGDHILWRPGHGCPVPKCVSKLSNSKFKDVHNFRKHWAVIHMPYSLRYFCVYCGWSTKKRNYLDPHYRIRHNLSGGKEPVESPREEQPNAQYIDPFPLTLDTVLGLG